MRTGDGHNAMIDHYSFGQIEIDGQVYTSDVVVYPNHVDGSWWRKRGHVLCMDDLRDVVAAEPDILVVGTGAYGAMQVPQDVQQQLANLGIGLRVAQTDEACTLFNEATSGRKVVAALHLTC